MALSDETEERTRRVKVVLLCVAWYGFSAITNNLSKKILNEMPLPQTMTVCQLTSVLCLQPLFMRFLKVKYQTLSPRNFMTKLLPLSAVRVVAMILGTFSILLMPVSYAHTIKAISPVCTVAMAYIILREKPTPAIVMSLLPIVIGILIATVTEVHFDLTGMLCALTSTVIFSWQNIYNKKLMRLHILDHMNLLYHSTRASLLLLIPFWFCTDGIKIMTAHEIWTTNPDFSWTRMSWLLMLDGVTYYGQNITAFSVLFLVSPVSYSVANTSKRIVIITSSLVVFQNQVSWANVLGMALAISGVGAYNLAKFEAAKKKKGLKLPQNKDDGETTIETPFMEYGDKAIMEAGDAHLHLTPRNSIVQLRSQDGHLRSSYGRTRSTGNSIGNTHQEHGNNIRNTTGKAPFNPQNLQQHLQLIEDEQKHSQPNSEGVQHPNIAGGNGLQNGSNPQLNMQQHSSMSTLQQPNHQMSPMHGSVPKSGSIAGGMGRAGGETHHRASLGVYNRTGSGLSISSNSSFAEQLSRQTDQAAGVAMHDVIHGRTDPVTDSHQHAN